MAWNTLTYACGHTEEVQLYGKMDGRERAVATAENHDCAACRAAKATSIDQSNNLPALVGSEKQIGWASECRAKLLPMLDAEVERANGYLARIDSGEFPGNPSTEKIAAAREEIVTGLAAIDKIRKNTKAGYWIDNRLTAVRTIVSEAAKA